MNNAPEFSSVSEFVTAQRSLIDEQAAAAVSRAVAEFRAEGVTVPAATEAALTQRVRKMLIDRLDQMAISLEKQLKEQP